MNGGTGPSAASAAGPRIAIGDFSKMTYLSINALRGYDETGLLVPAGVNRSAGYPYYEASQVPLGQVIRRCRDLGMPLGRIRQVIGASDPATAEEIIVLAHLRDMEPPQEWFEGTVTLLRHLLEQPHAPVPVSVEYRAVDPSPALAITEIVAWADLRRWWLAAFEELGKSFAETDATRAGPNGALYQSELFEEELGEVTAFIPIVFRPARPPHELPGRLHRTEIPGAEYALTMHEGAYGAFGDFDQTYGALGTYVSAQEIGMRGTIRENYLVTFAETADESAHRTEVCWPVFHSDTPTEGRH